MNPGKLNRRLTLHIPVTERGPDGFVKTEWGDLQTVWAGRRKAKGAEKLLAGAVTGVVTEEYFIRYRHDVTSEMRFTVDSQLYEMISPPIDPDGRRAFLYLTGRAVIDNG